MRAGIWALAGATAACIATAPAASAVEVEIWPPRPNFEQPFMALYSGVDPSTPFRADTMQDCGEGEAYVGGAREVYSSPVGTVDLLFGNLGDDPGYVVSCVGQPLKLMLNTYASLTTHEHVMGALDAAPLDRELTPYRGLTEPTDLNEIGSHLVGIRKFNGDLVLDTDNAFVVDATNLLPNKQYWLKSIPIKKRKTRARCQLGITHGAAAETNRFGHIGFGELLLNRDVRRYRPWCSGWRYRIELREFFGEGKRLKKWKVSIRR